MTTIVSGTPDTRTEHSPPLAAFGLMISTGIPVAVGIAGIIVRGWGAIHWGGAAAWGAAGALAFTLFGLMGKAMGMTRMDVLDLLGSMFAPPHTARSQLLGVLIHHIDGALLGIAWAYGIALAQVPANWLSGLVGGAILWVLAMLLMSSVGIIHPAIRAGTEEDPGPAATNLGKMSPMGALIAHLIYGIVLGALYQTWPLA
jgi:hypothetical protein